MTTGDANSGTESETVLAIRERWGDQVLHTQDNRGQWLVELEREALLPVVDFLKGESGFGFSYCVDVTGLDHYGEEPRFRALYVLRSMERNEDVVLKVRVPEEDPWAPSVTPAYPGANTLEREAYDMFGIEFRGHPDLRRILMPDMFEDFPLRKDFPMEGRMTDREWAEWIIARAQREEAHS